MIDVKNKKIINGHGTLGVTAAKNVLTVTSLEETGDIGRSKSLSQKETDHSINFYLSYEEWEALQESIDKLSEDNNSFDFREWKIIFDSLNNKSIWAWRIALQQMVFYTSCTIA